MSASRTAREQECWMQQVGHGHVWDQHIHRFSQAPFRSRATAVPNYIDRIKFDFSTAVARRLKPSRATAVPNSIHKSV